MKTLKINHAAVFTIVLIQQVIGGMWYSPVLFAGPWIQLTGKTMADFENATFTPYVVSIVASIITTYIMAYLFKKLHVDNFLKGLFYALLLWLAFLFVEMMTFNSFEMRPVGLTLINSGKSFLTFIVSGFILGMWKKFETEPKSSA